MNVEVEVQGAGWECTRTGELGGDRKPGCHLSLSFLGRLGYSKGYGSAEKMGGPNGSVSVCRSSGLGSRLQVGLRSVPRVFLLGLGLKGSSCQGTRKRVETFDAIEASSRNCHTIAPVHNPSAKSSHMTVAKSKGEEMHSTLSSG